MKTIGHLRYAWIALADARGHLSDALERAEADAGVGELGNRAGGDALAFLKAGAELLRPLLEEVESSTHNDNGETPLEWAREALEALRRYDHCYKGLGKAWDLPESAATDSSEEIKILEMIVAKLEKGASV